VRHLHDFLREIERREAGTLAGGHAPDRPYAILRYDFALASRPAEATQPTTTSFETPLRGSSR
jgi:hypothetical protein